MSSFILPFYCRIFASGLLLSFQKQITTTTTNVAPSAFMIFEYISKIASSLALSSLNTLPSGDASDAAKRIMLDGARKHDFHLLLLMTFLVVVGVVFEGPEIAHDVKAAWLRCRGKKIRNREAAPWITLAAAFGWLVIVIGVAGEGYWESAVSNDDGKIQAFDEAKLADATIKSNSAVADAVTLANSFGGLHKFVEAEERKIDQDLAGFKTYANDENQRTAALLTDLNRDRKELDKARAEAVAADQEAQRALAADNARHALRNLDTSQQKRIATAMSAWKTVPPVSGSGMRQQIAAVFSTSPSFDPSRLADQIADALGPQGGAGWFISRNPVTFGVAKAAYGVVISGTSTRRSKDVESALAAALSKEGILVNVAPTPNPGCEIMKMTNEEMEVKSECSEIVVMVGDHP